MKTRTFLLWVATLMIFAACSREETVPAAEKEGKMTFRLPAAKGKVTYATVTPLDSENQIDELYIYMFKNSGPLEGTLEYVFTTADIELSGTGSSLTATIDVTGKTGSRTFCFVANGVGRSATLNDLLAGVTQLDDFREAVTDQQDGLLATPLLMSASVVVADLLNPTPGEKEVHLKRRVARFDVLNDASETNFEIRNILISNAALQGHLHAEAVSDVALATGNLPTIPFNTTLYPNANTTDPVESVFYLNPTDLASGKTEISFEGTFNGQTKIYTLTPEIPVPVQPNYRYLLKAQKVDLEHVEWIITVDEWDDGSDLQAEPEEKQFDFSGLAVTAGAGATWDLDDRRYDISDATTPGVIRFTTGTPDIRGTRLEVTYRYNTTGSSLLDNGFVLPAPAPVLTYSGMYIQNYVIDIPVQNPRVPIEMEIAVFSVANPINRTVITVYGLPKYEDTDHRPVLLGGIHWAPVNVGATTIDATTLDLASSGYLYQFGRDYPMVHGVSGDEVLGPMSYDEAMETYKDKFISGMDQVYGANDWLERDDPHFSPRTNPWLPEINDSPCPRGWRVPAFDELELLPDAFSPDNYDAVTHRASFEGDIDGAMLYLPLTGARNALGVFEAISAQGDYYSSTATEDDLRTKCIRLLPTGTEPSLVAMHLNRARAMALRCVQAD